MDKKNVIGLTLIFALFLVWMRLNSVEESLPVVSVPASQSAITPAPTSAPGAGDAVAAPKDSQAIAAIATQNDAAFGAFSAASQGSEVVEVLENELFKVSFSNKGGAIKEVVLKKYLKVKEGAKGEEIKSTLRLLEDSKNRFEYLLPVKDSNKGVVSTAELFFKATKSNNEVVFRANAGSNGAYIEQKYTIQPDGYGIAYDIKLVGMDGIIRSDANSIELNWVNYLDKLEKNATYERNYSTIYYKPTDEKPDYCSCTSNDVDNVATPLKWVSSSNQFFNTSLVANTSFASANLSSEMLDEGNEDLKKTQAQIRVPFAHTADETFGMQLYVGPNEFDRLRAYNVDLENVISFGSSILGTINRWAVRPVFNFLSFFVSSKGLVILLLTLLIKLMLYPLTYKMIRSQSKMGALKPRLEVIKKKLGDNTQQIQMETMKIYREFGVNPLGGCLPMLLQMPIWLALYRFFPASIEFRQASFLWATDLSSYDSILHLGFTLPAFGSHVSLFAILWMVTTLIFTYYNSQNMDFSANPAMKWLQYLMPVVFLVFFNGFASGLSCYLCFSNILNIGQTLITKNYIIDQNKLSAELDAYKSKPQKKKTGFQARLESVMAEQQRIQETKKGAKK